MRLGRVEPLRDPGFPAERKRPKRGVGRGEPPTRLRGGPCLPLSAILEPVEVRAVRAAELWGPVSGVGSSASLTETPLHLGDPARHRFLRLPGRGGAGWRR